MRKFTAGLILAALIIGLGASVAQAEYTLPMRSADGKICFPKEHCSVPWTRYLGRSTGYIPGWRGWHCEPRNRFCWTGELGRGCGPCSTKTPPESNWARLHRERPNYRAEMMKHIIEPCYRAKILSKGLNQHVKMSEALELMKLFGKENEERMFKTMLPLVRKMKSRKARMLLYKYGARTCINAK